MEIVVSVFAVAVGLGCMVAIFKASRNDEEESGAGED